MWRFKPFMPKEPTGLEGRTVDVGNVKVHVRNAIAEGGFSCVYLACDAAHPSRQYALKHIICNDEESLDVAKKEISVMKLLKGHPNVGTVNASTIFDMGRTKEVMLLLDFCEKPLVTVLENRGAGYFEEKQVLLIFRDICNAVFAMHCQSPPIAHRDLKAENVLLGADGAWKLCDFGSTSTNHKCFDRPEEMGIEEDIIRKHTTPAYRAPEMWDLYRKEVISEKVDIWALGCLLYRICYLKSAFDGESKLQILNGNYRIPELPKYSSSVIELIKDMLQASPDARPDITQVWFRVNLQLPEDLQKQMPDGSLPVGMPDVHPETTNAYKEGPKKTAAMPRRSPPPPPSSREQVRNVSPQSEKEAQHSRSSQSALTVDGNGGPLGAFWSTQHAQESQVFEDKSPQFDEEPRSKHNQRSVESRTSPPIEPHARPGHPIRKSHGNTKKLDDGPNEDFEIRFDKDGGSKEIKASQSSNRPAFSNEAFNTFVAEFDTSKLSPGSSSTSSRMPREELEAEVGKLKEQLKQANLEKAEITSKYEKLSAICRSQRQEIQELKHALAAATPSRQEKDSLRDQSSSGSWQSSTPQREKIEGSIWELQQGMLKQTSQSPSPDSKPWQAFAEEPKSQQSQPAGRTSHPKSVRTVNGHLSSKQLNTNPANDSWGFEQDSFVAFPTNPQISRTTDQGSTSQRHVSSEVKVDRNQPAGWAGF